MALDARSGVDVERLFSPNDADRVLKFVDMIDQQPRFAFERIHREEISSAWDAGYVDSLALVKISQFGGWRFAYPPYGPTLAVAGDLAVKDVMLKMAL